MSRPRARRRGRRRRPPRARTRMVVGALTAVAAAAAGVALLFWITSPPPRQPFRFPSAVSTPTAAAGVADTAGHAAAGPARQLSDVASTAR
jgi:hypothetical protein